MKPTVCLGLFAASLLAFLGGVVSLRAQSPPGSLDLAFDTSVGANDIVWAAGLLTDGRIAITGHFTDFNSVPRMRIAQLDSAGRVDSSFASISGPDFKTYSLWVQFDQQVVVAGGFGYAGGLFRPRIARFQTNGVVDANFNAGSGTGGLADHFLNAVVQQPDGKFLIGGAFTLFNGANLANVARLLYNGAIDTTFTPGTGPNDMLRDIVVLPDQKILISGQFTTCNGLPFGRIARLHPNGTPDTSFLSAVGANGYVRAIAVQPDGCIVIGGEFTTYANTNRSRIARLLGDGRLDLSFDPGFGANGMVRSVARQADGKVVIAGEFTDFNGVGRNRIARLNANGSLDLGFNPGTGADGLIRFVLVQPDEKVLLCGDFLTCDGRPRRRIARLHGGSVPTLISQPVSQTNRVGQTAAFAVMASGSSPLRYQWLFKGSSLPGETNATLIRTNLAASDAGNYQVVVTNFAGVDYSAVAWLTVLTGANTRPGLQGSAFLAAQGFSFSSLLETSRLYSVEFSTNLSDWASLTNLLSPGGNYFFQHVGATNWPLGFYRMASPGQF